jgi:hypothetical protein
MSKLSTDEKAALMAIMAKLTADDDAGDEMAEALEAEAAASVERAEVFAAAESADLEARQAHDLEMIDAAAAADVRVIEAQAAAAVAVAAVEGRTAVDVAAAVSEPIDAATDVLEDAGAGEAGDSLDAAAELLGELAGDTPALEVAPLEVPDLAGDLVRDVPPIPQHWWTRPRGKSRR